MPNTRSAKKALRQTKKRNALNLQYKNAYKAAIKELKKLIAEKKDAVKQLQTVQKALDKAAKHGVIKKNTAARKLSRLAKKANTLQSK